VNAPDAIFVKTRWQRIDFALAHKKWNRPFWPVCVATMVHTGFTSGIIGPYLEHGQVLIKVPVVAGKALGWIGLQGGIIVKEIQLSRLELAFIIATRAMIGAGIALLFADRLGAEQRKAVGATLAIVGLVTTIPAVWAIFGKCDETG
jgi:hypothetical protein